MKKKTFKRAGAAVLSMAMLLSFGAIGATSAYAAADTTEKTVTIENAKKFAYKYSKIASLDTDGVTYTVESDWSSYFSVDAHNYLTLATAVSEKTKVAEFTTSKEKQALARAVADLGVADSKYTAVTADNVTLTPGYYIFKSSQNNAQPILLEVKADGTYTDLIAKANDLPFSKTITAITAPHSTENSNKGKDHLIEENGKKGLVEAGATVEYTLASEFPVYDEEAVTTTTNITDFTITDIPEDTLTINKSSITVYYRDPAVADDDDDDAWKTLTVTNDYAVEDVAGNATGIATDENGNEAYFTPADAAKDTTATGTPGFKVRFVDSTVINHRGQAVKIVFNATVSDTPDTNTDLNRNSAVLEYNNNYFTGGSKTKENPDYNPDEPESPDNPKEIPDNPENPNKHEDDDADVYCTLLTVNKVDQDNQALQGATFALYKGTGTSKVLITTLGEQNATKIELDPVTGEEEEVPNENYLSTFNFTGLDIGEYTLVEQTAPTSEYVKAPDVTFTITEEGWNGTFSFDNAQIVDNTIKIENTKGQTLPGTGGMGTILFTVGGAAIVLLAGALFVVYSKKRKVEE